MDEIQYYDMQESAAMGQIMSACAKAIFDAHEAETMAQLQHHVYKYTTCGPSVSFELNEGACEYEPDSLEAPIGLDTHRKSPFVYCGDDRASKITEPWLSIRQFGVSSIVEGVDYDTETHWLDLMDFCNDEKYEGDLEGLKEHAVKEFDRIISLVDSEAETIWNDTHGCPSCAKHHGYVNALRFECKGDDGMTPVWEKCRKCKGQGSII